ncbi:type II toxin-antitoxin system RelE/ParE family toxin [Lonepinella koalarum]|uniref:Putative addiction module killer protein n=1 Tax=Lonepinella koalarum TaxID=53417 RepID=A0A4R1L2Q4_9PAST|nr:type II toxin-antitoxin system RelE/ParE family toxin [Lonepinella koalarum]MDH2926109.1 hypothetical protein [Lonepinella koalarum]TCK71260.1 putative addiction module killer protein [Lonepinella koalarum]TFJ90981.1 type II toxin-antitoxin system RelE/ParE family toxin [Lonepinella koalarum]TYG34782.1 type II toxin-antitoxin system RelE/ParE family toxin [Lonepinella koalarum]
MNTIKRTAIFIDWLQNLKNRQAVAVINTRIKRAINGNFGDYKSVGGGVYEMRIPLGAGYRVYYAQDGETIYFLLNGGDKSTQQDDINKAKAIWADLKNNNGG